MAVTRAQKFGVAVGEWLSRAWTVEAPDTEDEAEMLIAIIQEFYGVEAANACRDSMEAELEELEE